MSYEVNKTEHSGAKKGKGAFWGRKQDAKSQSNKRRRNIDKIESSRDSEREHYERLQDEAMDRTFIQLQNLESALGEHPAIKGNSERLDLYASAVENLTDLYQHLGRR